MNPKELRAAALQKAEALRTRITGENRAMTDEERAEFQGYLDECDRLGQQIEQDERFLRTQQTLNATRQDQQTNRPNTAGSGAEVHDNAEDAPFKNFGEHLQAVQRAATSKRADVDPRLRKLDVSDLKVRAAAGMNETVASDGGFLLTTETGALVEKAAFETGVLASKITEIPLGPSSVGIKLPTVDETSRVNGSRWGGVRAYWAAEAASVTGTKPKFGQIELGLNKLMCLCYSTDELLLDAVALGSIMQRAVGEELAFALDDAIMRGTGAGIPVGILNASATVSIAKETSQPAATILYQNVSKMRARMLPRSFAKAAWYINADCMPTLELMVIPHKNVAGTENVSGQAVWQPARGAADPPNGTIFGRPVIPIEHCETVGTVGDIVLADFSEYLMTRKGGVQAASSIHVNFLTDETAFRFIMRTDGQPSRKSAITPYKGSATLSSFLTLATRS